MFIKKSFIIVCLTIIALSQVPNHLYAQSVDALSKQKSITDEALTPSQLANDARAAITEKKYLRAAALLERAFSLDRAQAGNAYDAACAYALAGEKERAFEFLQLSLDAGFLEIDHIKQDSDLIPLHQDSRWLDYLSRVQIKLNYEERLWDSKTWKTPYAKQLSVEQRVAGLSKFWSEVKYNFVFTDKLKKLDWDAVYVKYLSQVINAKSTLEYYKILMEMCSLLQDGHTNVYAPDELYASELSYAPFRTALIEGKVIITKIVDETLRKKGLLEGVEITAVDGQNIIEWTNKNTAPFVSAATPQDLDTRIFNYTFLSGSQEHKPTIDLNDANNKQWQVQVERVSYQVRNRISRNSAFNWKLLPGNIALISLNTFENDFVAQEYLKIFPEISQANAIIFDIRRNGGGNGNVGYTILSTLTNQDFAISRSRTRDYKPTYRARGQIDNFFEFKSTNENPHPQFQFKGKVAVLTSAQTFSAAEDFAVAFDMMKRGTIIGEATAGSTGQPMMFDLPGGGRARVCTKEDTYRDGRAFVGVGVQPNLVVHPSLSDFRAGRDTVLEAALDYLKK